VKVNGELVNTKDTKIVEYKSPITRVVNLLEKMRAQLIAEADKEAEMYDQMVCWCETNEKEKKKAIADADALINELQTEIEERSAKLGHVVTEIERLKEQIAEDTESLKTATAIREKEAAKFREENKDLVQWITNVKNAITILEKSQGHYNKGGPEGEAFVQLDASVLSSIRTVLKDLAFKAQMFEAGKSETHRKQTGSSFLSLSTDSQSLGDKLLSVFDSDGFASGAVPLDIAQRVLADNAKKVVPQASFLQGNLAPTAGSYSTRSSVIFGILTQMKEEFESNLSQEQKEEMKAQEDFKAMAKAKAEQIEIAKEKLDELEEANADNIKALSDAKENLELTREQRSKDVEFLQNLKVTCMDLDNQWEIRSKTRAEETQAVSEALAVIKGDDNMDLLRDTVKFLQVGSESQQQATMRMRRTNTMAFLRKAAQAPGFEADDLLAAWRNRDGSQQVSMIGAAAGPRMQLSTLAVSVGLDSFTQIKEAMDKMVAELKEEQVEEVKFKEYCTKELNLNEKQTYEKTEQKEDLEALIDKLNKLIKKLNEEIADHNKQIADTEVAIKKASQVREEENAEFQTTVADQRATQDILHKALEKLKSFYKTDKGGRPGVFAQQTPPVQFNAFKKNAGANPVIGMIEQIVEDSKKLEKDAVDAETEAQSHYETFVADSNALIKSLSDAIAAKTKAVAKATEDLEQGKSDLDSTIEELQSLAMTAHALHGECDWVVRNFELRQKARLQEMEAIGQAKAILSGEGIIGQ
jgi:ABC-type transporter Mla subunit MlaD